MAGKWLKPINILAVVAVLFIAAFSWLFLPRAQFAWAAYLIALILLLTLYTNVRKPLIDRIEARRRAKNRPADAAREKRLMAVNYGAMAAVLAIAVLGWLVLPREQFLWAVVLDILILLVVGYVNVRRVISDIF